LPSRPRISVTYRDAVLVGEQVFLEGIIVEIRPRIAKTRAIMWLPQKVEAGEKIIKCEATGTYFLDSPRIRNRCEH